MKAFYERISKLSPKRLALLAIDLQSQINALTVNAAGVKEPIAIVGMGCRFPGGGTDPEKFWELLCHGKDCVIETPRERWRVEDYYHPDPDMPGMMSTRFGGFLESVDAFDAGFFGIVPREAKEMDPQQRLLLEVAWEALENAAIPPDCLRGSATGVFVGICGSDYLHMLLSGDPADIGAYSATGNSHSVAAGRLAYILGLQGPAYAVDTACSSSLVAVHLACKSLLLGECRLALAGGVNLILSPQATIILSKVQMMASDGRCKAFDAAADGFVRGEGCGVVALKRLSHALEDGNRILAVIRGSAVNQDGRSNGLTAPNGPSQEEVIRAALKDGSMEPSQISYVECHGTGTALGDPIEAQALAAALGEKRTTDDALIIGTVKTNIGHLEAAAGIAGVIKTVLCLQHGELPASLHFREPNPHIAWQDLPIKVASTRTPWPSGSGLRAAGVSSFGFSGTNVHVILEEAPSPQRSENQIERPLHPFCLSAKSRNVLDLQVSCLEKSLAAQVAAENPPAIGDIAYTLNAGRSHLPFRLYLTAATGAEALEKLTAFSENRSSPGLSTRQVGGGAETRVAFLFTGQGSQYAGMGRELYETQPVFREALERCSELLAPVLSVPLLSVIYPEGGTDNLLDQTAYTQPALFALEYALTELWASWGIRPSIVMGHSVGEYVAACVAGVFSLEDGLRLIAERGRLIQSLPAGGAMAAVFADLATVGQVVDANDALLSVAAVNGPTNTVLSGPKDALAAILGVLEREGISYQYLSVSHAFHSTLMGPVMDRFERVASSVSYTPAQMDIVSNVTGLLSNGREMADPAYWCRHMRVPVKFYEGMRTLRESRAEVLVEVGPHPVLVGMGRRCLSDDCAIWLPSLCRGRGDWDQILESLGCLYLRGITPDWSGFDAPYDRQSLALPTYPFEKERFWLKRQHRPGLRKAPDKEEGARGPSGHPLVDKQFTTARNETVFPSSVSRNILPFLEDHRVYGHVVLPAAVFIELVLAAVNRTQWQGANQISDFIVSEPLLIPEDENVELQLIFSKGSEHELTFEIFSSHEVESSKEDAWKLHASGRVGRAIAPAGPLPRELISLSGSIAGSTEHLEGQVYYETLEDLGIQFGPAFRGIQELWRGGGKALGRLNIPCSIAAESGEYVLHPALLDAALQTLGAALPIGKDQPAYLMVGFEKFTLCGNLSSTQWALGEIQSGIDKNPDVLIGDLRLLFADTGETLGHIKGLRLKRARREALVASARRKLEDWLYTVVWKPMPLEIDSPRSQSSPHVLSSPGEIISQLQPSLEDWDRRFGLNEYLELVGGLNKASGELALEALYELGFDFVPDREFDLDAFMSGLRIVPKYKDLARRLLDILKEEEIVVSSGERWKTASTPERVDPHKRLDTLRSSYPQFEGEVSLLTQCGSRLAQVLRGDQDPLLLLFPGGSMEAVEKLTQLSPVAQAYNGLIKGAMMRITEDLPKDGKMRVLEIGAGTGGTTSAVLPVLSSAVDEYTFTDIAHAFLTNARRKFSEYPFVSYRLLDIEQDPVNAGFQRHSYHLVLAANVLHATADLRDTLSHIKQLLAPGGLLVLLEGTGPQPWVDLTFGLTDGWWRFRDRDLRKSYPLIASGQWLELLAKEGFVGAEAIPRDSHRSLKMPKQTLIIARGPAEAAETGAAGLQGRKQSARNERRLWIVFADNKGFGQKIMNRIEALGHAHLLVSSGAQFRKLNACHWEIDCFRVEDYYRLFREAVDFGQYEDCRLLHLSSLDAASATGMTLATLESEVERSCRSVLCVIQAMMKTEWKQYPKLWIATSGAQSTDHNPTRVSLSQAPVWGLGRTIANEHPEVWGGMVDLEGTGSDDEIRELVAEISSTKREDQVILHSGGRHVGRLERYKLPRQVEGPVSFSGEHTYLITGGLGGMGLKLADWMTQKGARNLMLLGRSGADGGARQFLDRLEARGVRVEVRPADVSRLDDVQRALVTIESTMPPLRGIFHLAGVFEDRVLIRHSWDRFKRVFAPKIIGAWLLHELTQQMPLDYFVLFSSAASFLAPVGLGNYAAANTFLDALAHYRERLGLPSTCIDWGPWAKVGMAEAVGDIRENQWHQAGFSTMSAQQGLEILGLLLQRKNVQTGVLAADWRKYLARFRADGRPMLFASLVDAPHDDAKGTLPQVKAIPFNLRVQSLHPAERGEALLDEILRHVTEVLGFTQSSRLEPYTGFFDLGMDSLTAVELKNRLQTSLGLALSPTLVFDFPSAQKLTNYLLNELFTPAGPQQAARSISDQIGDKAKSQEALDDSTEDELASRLFEKLKQLE